MQNIRIRRAHDPSHGGQNAETSYCQIAADELGFRVGDVRFKHQDDAGFYTMTPDTSTNLTVNGWAVRANSKTLSISWGLRMLWP